MPLGLQILYNSLPQKRIVCKSSNLQKIQYTLSEWCSKFYILKVFVVACKPFFFSWEEIIYLTQYIFLQKRYFCIKSLVNCFSILLYHTLILLQKNHKIQWNCNNLYLMSKLWSAQSEHKLHVFWINIYKIEFYSFNLNFLKENKTNKNFSWNIF